jgi:D-alanyl-lipoteichoic acid acyltransferase DltB (MBOAT superfamily)
MLFSSPDYPLFLIAVFFLYALARWGGGQRAWWARLAVMVLLGDVVFMLVAKDPDTLWDPIGGLLLRLAAGDDAAWPWWLAVHWVIGAAALGGAIELGRRRAEWIASDHGQRLIARGFVGALAAIGAVVAIGEACGGLDEVTAVLVGHGHLAVLGILGVGLGASRTDQYRPLGRVILLFVASSLFYHAWASAMPGPYRYLLALLLGTIVLDYYLALWIERTEEPWRRKALVILSLCSNLGILAFFKYTDFLAQDVLRLDVDRLDLILPAGISFHTFQSLSYTIDVYRRELKATRSVVQFATFVLFFPQLVAGPIVRAQDLLPQLAEPPPLELAKATHGLFRIVVGLFKKIALADALALFIVDRVFEAPERFSSLEVLAGVYGYALQIYLDFSAYSDIAIGSAQVLGFDMPENFRTPYRSSNLQMFWRRWHISLSTWLRDYLYIALGGSKGTQARTYFNLIATMLLGGLWHGASWAFVVWGALHGFGLAVTRYFQRETTGAPWAAQRLFAGCAWIAILGVIVQRYAFPDDVGVWWHLVAAWLCLTPLWAVATAWLGRDRPEPQAVVAEAPSGLPWRALWATSAARGEGAARTLRDARAVEELRLAMCGTGILFLVALAYGEPATWIPTFVVTWALALAADVLETGTDRLWARAGALARRAIAVVLVFHYVCLGWIFFRATSFDNALAVMRQLALLETDHANVVPLVSTALAVGMLCHFFPDGSFRWLRTRFVALPAWGQGAALAGAALVLRELAHTKIVPFIYFQF